MNCSYTPNRSIDNRDYVVSIIYDRSMLSDSREAWTFEKLFSETSTLLEITSNTLGKKRLEDKNCYVINKRFIIFKIEMGTSRGEKTDLITPRVHNIERGAYIQLLSLYYELLITRFHYNHLPKKIRPVRRIYYLCYNVAFVFQSLSISVCLT